MAITISMARPMASGRYRAILHRSPLEALRNLAFGRSLLRKDERIWLDALPSAFHGLRIVQISDIHHGLFLPKEWLSAAVRQANRLNPDIIALTGDFVTYSRRNIGPAAELLGRLRAKYGVYAVLGNHDFRVDAGCRSLRH